MTIVLKPDGSSYRTLIFRFVWVLCVMETTAAVIVHKILEGDASMFGHGLQAIMLGFFPCVLIVGSLIGGLRRWRYRLEIEKSSEGIRVSERRIFVRELRYPVGSVFQLALPSGGAFPFVRTPDRKEIGSLLGLWQKEELLEFLRRG